jgi:hypothetical protein
MAVLSLYLYGGLWAYSVVFAASFAANVPVTFLNGGRTCNVEEDGAACTGNFFVWLGVFALLAVPLSCLELREQVYVQVLMFCARILVVLLMAGTVLAGYGCGRGGGTVFADMGPGEPAAAGSGAAGAAPLLRLAGLSHVMPVSIYAFIFHHSVPVLSQPVADKRSLRTVFLVAFLIVGAAYAGLGVVLAGWFGEHVDAQCNLNWRQYVGCAAPHADGSPVTLGDRSGAAAAVSFVVLIFPALDVLSAFPLNAVTLGNNLMSACYGAAAGAGADADCAGDAAAGGGSAKAAQGGAGGDAAAAPSPWRRVVFRLVAAVPPVFAGALSTYYNVNLGTILQFTGLIGVAIAFGIPAVLRLWSFARHAAAVRAVGEELELAEGAGEGAGAGAGAGEREGLGESEGAGIAARALARPLPRGAWLRYGRAREAPEVEAAVLATPYTWSPLLWASGGGPFARADHALLAFSLVIGAYVLAAMVAQGGAS